MSKKERMMDDMIDETVRTEGEQLRQRIQRLFGGSLHKRQVDAGSCNACESEIKMLTSP